MKFPLGLNEWTIYSLIRCQQIYRAISKRGVMREVKDLVEF
jgi:hypothetical protein